MSLQPGVVRDGIVWFLREQGVDGATVAEVRAAVEERLGQEVPPSSVRSYLNLNTPGQFERVGRGVYRLANV
jgi:site-specific DNA-methyltransferase (adenine-specific)